MNAIDFLKKELQTIADKFPTVHIKYGYNDRIDNHIVELLPLAEYTNNKKLDDAWIPVSIKFLETYKDQEVAFISSNSGLSLNESIFEFNAPQNKEENIIGELFSTLTTHAVKYSFSTFIPNGLISPNAINLINMPVEQLGEESIINNSYPVAA